MRSERRLRWNASSSASTDRIRADRSPGAPCDARVPSRLRHRGGMLDPLLDRLGVLSAAQLDAMGVTRRSRDEAVARGRLVRVRRGWFARPDADRTVVDAVRAEGCVSCASALRLRGAWVPEGLAGRHVRHADHRREQGRRGCLPHGGNPPVRAALDDLETAFRCVLRCGSAEDVVVIADSLLHLRLVTLEDLAASARSAPRWVTGLLATTDRAESGLESIVRVRLRSCRLRVRAQVWIGARRVDLVVGDRLVIECDGAEHHGGWAAQSADRARDRALVASGYLVMRVTYRQVLDDWPAIEQEILAVVRRREHRWPRRRDAV
ncbi:endonuclease domain-containing protein [Agrococcus jejuensis]|uniref:endonuclease domain-containing protein n=1 Tax=Agrococcus jejuensis TaxID=399736 RepID=UPI0011A7ED14